MDITYDYYRIFYHVAELGSFTKAAAALNRGQPNITKAIKNLEHQLGCRLFVRSSRGVRLTREGEKLFAHIRVAFDHISMAEQELHSDSDLAGGSISIATTEIAMHLSTMQAVADFRRDHPDVRLQVTSHNSVEALAALKSGAVDLAVITVRDSAVNDFSMTTIREFREILCCKAGYLERAGLEDRDLLAGGNLISLVKHSYGYDFYREYYAELGILWEPQIEVSIIDQILLLIRNGVGIGFVPDLMAQELIRAGEIQEIPLKSRPPMRKICLVQDRKRELSKAARTFAEYLR